MKYASPNMANCCLREDAKVSQVWIGGFKNVEDFKMYSHIHGYDGARCLYLPSGEVLAAVSGGIYGSSHKASRRTLIHHLFNIHTTKKLFKAIGETSNIIKR